MINVNDNIASNLGFANRISCLACGQNLALVLIAIFLSIGLMIPSVYAGCACSAVGNWDPTAFLNSDVPGFQSGNTGSGASATSASNSTQSASQPVQRSELFPNGQIIKPPQSVSSSDVVLDVSNGNGYGQSHIKGAINIPSKSFLNDNGTLKSAPELAQMLGEAGVSRNDPVVVYSDNLGDASFAFWVLRYLGQDDIKVLDGSLHDWKAAGLPTEISQNTRPALNYIPRQRQELLADYDYVKSGKAQIVDARTFQEFGKGRISNAISLDSAKVLVNGKVKNGNDLTNAFSGLSKDKPVIVYSSEYNQASLLWYALQLMGYDARIYTWGDWIAHQPISETGKTSLVGKATANSGHYQKLGK